MGQVFEELLRRFSEMSNETSGEHYTPRDVVRLLVSLLFAENTNDLKGQGIVRSIFDPCCGTGGMLTIGKEYFREHINPNATIRLLGQELNAQSYATCKSDMLITEEDPDNIRLGSSLSNDQFQGQRFDYMITNPPFGVSWKSDQEVVKTEATNSQGRFSAGTPRSSDGALLFLQHMLSKMEDNGSRVGIVFNGSPLFTGDAGSGESDIRKWIIENDWLECIIALPEKLFFNTSIATYIWILTNRKAEEREGKIQLINAVEFYDGMKRNLGDKNAVITETISLRLLKCIQILKKLTTARSSQMTISVIPRSQLRDHSLTKRQGILSLTRVEIQSQIVSYETMNVFHFQMILTIITKEK